MANTYSSQYMSLQIPSVGLDPGPQWATDLNQCIVGIDQHNHSAGSGVQITPSGLNINADLSIGANNLTNARSLRLSPILATTTTDLACLYVIGADLYYRDTAGNPIRVTQSGAIAISGASGFSGLAAPASASYSSSTFVFQSNVNVAGNLDGASLVLRNNTALSKGYTINPPSAMAANYSLTLPLTPAAQSVMFIDNTGAMSTSALDGSTIVNTSGVVKVPANGITATQIATNAVGTTQIANAAITPAKMAARNVVAGSGFSWGAANLTLIGGGSISITSTGRPVLINAFPGFGGGASYITAAAANVNQCYLYWYRDGVAIAIYQLNAGAIIMPGGLTMVDTGATAASHTYQILVQTQSSSGDSINCYNVAISATEL